MESHVNIDSGQSGPQQQQLLELYSDNINNKHRCEHVISRSLYLLDTFLQTYLMINKVCNGEGVLKSGFSLLKCTQDRLQIQIYHYHFVQLFFFFFKIHDHPKQGSNGVTGCGNIRKQKHY